MPASEPAPRGAAVLIAAMVVAPVLADVGPPVPVLPSRTPAQQAITPLGSITACQPAHPGEVVVCGRGTSPYRLPLPDERPAHIVRGEAPHGVAGGNPVAVDPGVGLTLTLKADGKAKVTGNAPN